MLENYLPLLLTVQWNLNMKWYFIKHEVMEQDSEGNLYIKKVVVVTENLFF